MNKKIKFYLLFLVTIFFVSMNNVFARSYTMELIPYNVSTACDLEVDGGQACFEEYLAGNLDSYLIDNGIVEGGENIMIITKITPTSDSQVTGIQYVVKHDTSKVDYYVSEFGEEVGVLVSPISGENLGYTYNFFPVVTSGRTQKKTWTTSGDPAFWDGNASILYNAGDALGPLVKETPLSATFYTVKDSITPGSKITFEFSTDPAETDLANPTSSETKYATFKSLTLNVLSTVSNDGTLSALSAKGSNGLNYPFGFVPSDDKKLNYSFKVPNSVTSVTFTGTSTDSNVKGITGLDSARSLNVGDNTLNIAVTAETGDITTYKITVRRLSNDATLKSISNTNSVSFGALSSSTFTYSTTVPYKTTSTVATPVTNHSDATIQETIPATWNITTDNTTNKLNTYYINVDAENCKYTASEVPGNICTTQKYTFNITRTAPSKNVTLSELKVDGVSVPGFSPTKYEYTLSDVAYSKTSINISAKLSDSLNTITSGTGSKTVSVGDNTYKVLVTSEDNITKQEYTIHLHRKSNENALKTLSITSSPQGTLSPSFTSGFTGDYTYTYDPNVDTININAVVKDTDKAQVEIIDATDSSNEVTLASKTYNTTSTSIGISTKRIKVVVTPEDEATSPKTYTIDFARQKSTNNYLSSLSINPGTINETFNPTKGSYTAVVDADVTSTVVTAVPADKNAKVTSIVGDSNFKFGAGNTITISVLSEEGKTNTYTINVTRKQYNIATLSDIKVGFGSDTPTTISGFNPNTFEYTLYTNANPLDFDINSINISSSKSNEYSVVSGDNGTKTVKTGDNTYSIKVVSQEGTVTNTYKIHVYRQKNTDNETKGVSVAGVAATTNPGDDKNYYVTLPNTKTSIVPSEVIISASSDATVVKNTGNLSLSTTSDNIFNYAVTSEDGVTENYVIHITREKSVDASISTVHLKLKGETTPTRSCTFTGTNTTCTIVVPEGTTEYYLIPDIHSAASVSPDSSTKYTMDLSDPNDSIQNRTLTVTAENTDVTKSYTVKVERAKSSNANLSSITLTNVTNGANENVTVPNFSPTKTSYNITVPGTTEDIKVEAAKEDSKATITTTIPQIITLSNYGVNQFTINVTAEDGKATKAYVLNITRLEKLDNTLADLKVEGTTITGFSSNTTSYAYTKVPYSKTTLNIDALVNDNDSADTDVNAIVSAIKVNGKEVSITQAEQVNKDITLATGNNTIEIIVAAQNRSQTKKYEISVERELNDDTGIQGITVAGVNATLKEGSDYKYTVTVPNNVTIANQSNVVVTPNDGALATDAKATYTVPTVNLLTLDSTGNTVSNIVNVAVTSESNNVKVYEVEVIRTPSNVSTVSSIDVFTDVAPTTPKSCVFNGTNVNCTINAEVSTTSVTLSGHLTDTTANIEFTDGVTTGDTFTMAVSQSNKVITATVTAENGVDKTVYTVTINRQKSSDIYLKILETNANQADSTTFASVDSFAKETTTYNITVPGVVDKIKVRATANDSKSKLTAKGVTTATPVDTINFEQNLNYGENTIEIYVEAEDKSPGKYTIKVTRELNINNYLSSLKVENNSVDSFDKTIEEYNLNKVIYTTDKINIKADTEDPLAKVTNISVNGKNVTITPGSSIDEIVDLSTGNNEIIVTVSAHNTTLKKNYKINVEREKNSDTGIQKVEVYYDGALHQATYNSEKNVYEITVPYNTTVAQNNTTNRNGYIVVTPNDGYVTTDAKATVTMSSTNLLTDDPSKGNVNDHSFTVTAEDGTEKTYNMKITRTKNNLSQLSRVNLYKGLETTTTTYCVFDSGKVNCTIPVPVNTTIFKLEGIIPATSNNATIAFTDGVTTGENYTLSATESTKVITATVTAENGVDYTDYTITVERAKSANNYLSDLQSNADSATLVTLPDFATNKASYEIEVPGTQSSIDLKIVAEDPKSKVTTASVTDTPTDTLTFTTTLNAPGQTTTINFEVQAENGAKLPYTIKVKRLQNVEPRLSGITINGTNINDYLTGSTFDKDTYTYNLDEFPYQTDKVTIGATSIDTVYGTQTNTGVHNIQTIYYNTDFTDSNHYVNKIVIRAFAQDKSVYKDYTINITRAANTDTSITKVEMNYDGSLHAATYDSNEDVYRITVPNSVTKANSSNVVVTPSNGKATTDAKATVTMTETDLKTNDAVNDNVNTHNFVVTAEDGTIKTYTMIITREKSDESALTEILVKDPTDDSVIGSFNPTFKENVYTYNVNVPVTTKDFNVEVSKKEPNAIVTGEGKYTLTSSTMKVTVSVTPENGDASKVKNYVLNIIRDANNNNDLSTIEVKDKNNNTYTVTQDTTSPNKYKVTIPGEVDTVLINATADSALASIKYINPTVNPNEYTVPVGDTEVEFQIESESGASQSYYVNITRSPKTESRLSTLTYTLSDGTVGIFDDFDPDTLSYTIPKVPYSTSGIYITSLPIDSDATVSGKVGSQSIITGDNKYVIKVTAQDNKTITEYEINVERTKNNDATLRMLTINGEAFNESFVSTTFDYSVTVGEQKTSVKRADITAIPSDSKATITYDPEIALSTESVNYYKVKVTAEDGITTNTYTIAITRPKSTDNTLKNVVLTGASLSPVFSPSTKEYTIIVPYGQTDFSIQGIPNANTSVVYGNGDYSLSNSTINLSVMAEDPNVDLNIYKFNVVEAKSTDATLVSLSVSGYPFKGTNTSFVTTTTDYTIGDIETSVKKLMINATTSNANSTLKFYNDGDLVGECTGKSSCEISLKEGLGTKSLTVEVIAPDDVSKKSYNITYNKINSSNAYLANIESSYGTFDKSFNKTTKNYILTLPYENDSTTLTITSENSDASIKVNGDTAAFSPRNYVVSDIPAGGTKTVTVNVTAQDGITKETYTIIVERSVYTGSSDANLASLAVNGYTLSPSFDSMTLDYSIGQIPYSLAELTINATPNISSSKVSYYVNGIPQESNIVSIPRENSTITVKVTAEDGKTVKNYTIKYTKKANNNAYLESLTTSKGTLTPTFEKNTGTYTINVDKDTNSIDLTAKLEDENASIKINGDSYVNSSVKSITNLQAGNNTTTIVVTAEDGSTTMTYKINIVKEAEDEIITSKVYGHTIANGYIMTVAPLKTVKDIKDELDNDNVKLEVWTAENSSKLTDTDTIGTGMIVKLVIGGSVVDSKVIIIKGDVTGDGEVDIFDSSDILNHYVGRKLIVGHYLVAGDVTEDGEVDIFDSSDILNHYVGRKLLTYK